MSTVLTQNDRKIVPRWRDSTIAATTGELEPLSRPTVARFVGPDELTPRVVDWRGHGSVAFASDLVSAGLVLDARGNRDVMDAVDYILSRGSSAPVSVRRLAMALVDEPQDRASDPDASTEEGEGLPNESRLQIRSMKSRLRSHPRNGLVWVDMARHYAMLGADRHAIRSMRNGLALAPYNRFVLRSAARLYVHLGDAEQAYELLRRCPATQRDPWLRAAEIAVAGLIDRTPQQLRRTRRGLLAGNLDPVHISELASAVATSELDAGSVKSARRLFNIGLDSPTENSVAQADWATNKISGISLNEAHFRLPRTFEAKAIGHFERLELQECLVQCNRWLEDEPFSSRPVELSTFISVVGFEDYENAINIAKRGLMSNPGNFALRNNFTVALAESGRVDEAMEYRRIIRPSSLSVWEETCWLATNGLLAFRERRHDEGRMLYIRAVASARGQSDKGREAMVLTHWAREELRAGEYTKADEIARQATQASTGLSASGVKMALARLDRVRNGDKDVKPA